MSKLKIKFRAIFFLALLVIFCMPQNLYSQDNNERQEIIKTGELIRAAFSKGDIKAITSLYHPDVIKALGYKNLLTGREAVIKDLAGTLNSFSLEFVTNTIESILIQGDIAIEQTLFAIKGTPKNGGDPFVFSGRTQVTYIRYKKSPTGWATIREMIQPADH